MRRRAGVLRRAVKRADAAAGETARPAWNRAVLWHAGLFLAFLAGLRVEKALALGVDPGGAVGWLRFVAPDVALVLAFEGLWLFLGPGAVWRWGLALAHLAVLLLTAVAHSFLLITGYRLELALAAYAVRNFGILREIFVRVADAAVEVRLALGAIAALLPLALRRRAAAPSVSRLWAGGALTVGLAVTLLPPGSREPALARSDAWVFLTSGRQLLQPGSASRYAVEPASFYRAPELRSAAARRPNLILVILESTGAGAVATSGADSPTPALARLAAGGITVESAYASVTHTSKALIGILCGVMPRLQMDIVESLEGNLPIPCLPRLLGDLGYRTVFLQSALARFENRPGLVRNLGYAEGAYRETMQRPGYPPVGYFGLDDAAMLEPALAWIAAAGDEPWFITLLTSVPHHPYQTPGMGLRQALAAPREAYAQAIARQDRFLGDLVRGLEEMGVLGNGVLVVLGDHGEAFGEHRRRQHDAVPYEEVVRVPWVLYGPAVLGPPRTVTGLRHHVDLLPTVLAMLGAEWEGRLPGRDLLAGEPHDLVLSSCWWANTCVGGRVGDFKLIHHFGRRPPEVFDLTRDPREHRDLGETLPAEERRELEDRLLGYKISIDRFWAQFPVHDGPQGWWAEGLTAKAGDRTPAPTPPGGSS